jgi:hypothetical protein
LVELGQQRGDFFALGRPEEVESGDFREALAQSAHALRQLPPRPVRAPARGLLEQLRGGAGQRGEVGAPGRTEGVDDVVLGRRIEGASREDDRLAGSTRGPRAIPAIAAARRRSS